MYNGKNYSVDVEKENKLIVGGCYGSLQGAVYSMSTVALYKYEEKGIIDSVDTFMDGTDHFTIFVKYNFKASHQAVNGIRKKLENIFKKCVDSPKKMC